MFLHRVQMILNKGEGNVLVDYCAPLQGLDHKHGVEPGNIE